MKLSIWLKWPFVALKYECDPIIFTTAMDISNDITLSCPMNAGGGFISLMFMFPRYGPAEAIYKYLDKEWINENLFFERAQHICVYIKPSSH